MDAGEALTRAREAVKMTAEEERQRHHEHAVRCLSDVRRAVATAVESGAVSCKVLPPAVRNLWLEALGYTATWGKPGSLASLAATLRAEGYAVRAASTRLEIEICWAPMSRCRRVLWEAGWTSTPSPAADSHR